MVKLKTVTKAPHFSPEAQAQIEMAETAEGRVINQESGEDWTLIQADCVQAIRLLPAGKTHYSIFSPPFRGLYTYSDSDRDMGNCRNDAEFAEHFRFLVIELHRIMMPGRLVSIHCMNIPTSKERDGIIGISDFRGELIRVFKEVGFIYHSEVCIWKDPVTAMQRTKALGLLHKQIRKDSAMSRQGIPDYLVTMRKLGVNPEPIAHTAETFPVSEWQQLASPVWANFDGENHDGFRGFKGGADGNGIDPSDTLQSIADEKDTRHICPLQLPVIQRGIRLWTNPGDIVFSPFAGIGSEGHQAILMDRRFIGVELKEAYWKQGCKNLKRAVDQKSEKKLFK